MRHALSCALARSPGPRRRAWARFELDPVARTPIGAFLRLGLVASLVRGDDLLTGRVVAVVALVAQRDQASAASCQIRAAAVSWVLPGSSSETYRMLPSGEAITCRFMPCILCLPE
jgi:hypothetical protein